MMKLAIAVCLLSAFSYAAGAQMCITAAVNQVSITTSYACWTQCVTANQNQNLCTGINYTPSSDTCQLLSDKTINYVNLQCTVNPNPTTGVSAPPTEVWEYTATADVVGSYISVAVTSPYLVAGNNGGSSGGGTGTCQGCSCVTNDACKPRCTFAMQSWGLRDSPYVSYGYIQVNYQLMVQSTDTGVGSRAQRGIYLLAVNASANCSAIGSVARFDPLGTPSDTQRFIDTVNGFPNGVILLSATADEPSINFQNAYSLIKSIGGPDLSQNFGVNGKFAFAVQLGSPSKGVHDQNQAGQPKINLNVVLSGQTDDEVVLTQTL